MLGGVGVGFEGGNLFKKKDKKPKKEKCSCSYVCDRCAQKPIPFECAEENGGKVEIGFYHVVDRETKDPTILMSSGMIMFRICCSERHPVCEHEAFLCTDCFDELYRMGDDDEGEEWKKGKGLGSK